MSELSLSGAGEQPAFFALATSRRGRSRRAIEAEREIRSGQVGVSELTTDQAICGDGSPGNQIAGGVNGETRWSDSCHLKGESLRSQPAWRVQLKLRQAH